MLNNQYLSMVTSAYGQRWCPRCGNQIVSTGGMCNCGWMPGQEHNLLRDFVQPQVLVCPKCNGETVVDDFGSPAIFHPCGSGTQRTCPTCSGKGFVTA